MKLLNRLGLFTRNDLRAIDGMMLRHSIQTARILNHAYENGYVPPEEVVPYQNRRYHLDRLISTIRMKAPGYARMMNL